MAEQQEKDGFFRRLPTEVIVRTRSGREHREYAEYAKGDPWSTERMSDHELALKARTYLGGILPVERIDALVASVLAVDGAASLDMIARAMATDG